MSVHGRGTGTWGGGCSQRGGLVGPSQQAVLPLGFSYEKDTRLYFDDTCVVPERLEGKRGSSGGHAWAQCWHELGLRSAAALRLVVAERPSHRR